MEQIKFINEVIEFLDERNMFWDKDSVEEVIELLKGEKKRLGKGKKVNEYQVL